MYFEEVMKVFVCGIMVALFFIYCGRKLLSCKVPKTINSLFIIVFLIVLSAINYLVLDNMTKLVTLYVAVMFTYKVLFKKNIAQCAIASFISYLLLALGEMLFVVGISIVNMEEIILNEASFRANILANAIICLFGILILLLFYRRVNKFILRVKENSKFNFIFTFAIVLTAIGALFYKINFNGWRLDEILMLNLSIIISMLYIGFVIIKQYFDKEKISDNYEKYVEYSKQSEKLVEQYSISQHENKNELIVIKSMVHKNNKKLLEYLNEIIISKDNIENAWIRYLRYIPFGGLKGILHNKISSMKDDNINVFLNISKDIGKSKLNQLTMKENNQLVKIIGVFLDNANEASSNSTQKEVSINIYLEEKDVVFEISNTYSNSVNLNNIYDSGQSSKGKNRGYGLSLVKSILDESSMFENTAKIMGCYFVQKLKVKK